MGLVKGLIDDLTYAIMTACNVVDDDEGKNHDEVFKWVMNHDYAHLTQEEIITLYKKEKGL